MADATLSMVLLRLGPMIGEMVKDELKLHLDAKPDLDELSKKLEKIRTVLAHAEQREPSEEKVRSWLAKLRDIAYKIDDVLVEYSHDVLKQKFEMEEEHPIPTRPWEKLIFFLQSFCCNVVPLQNFKRVVERRSIAVTIRELNGKLDSIEEENEREFKFLPNLPLVPLVFQKNETDSQIDVSEVKGRENELKELVSELVGESGSGLGHGHNENKVQVISIVGTGGMGKTTLAQCAYEKVKGRFDERVWVCVSDPFDRIKIAKAILEELTKNSPNLTDWNSLLNHIKEAIENRKIIIVLDDVWLEKEKLWNPLWICLKNNCAPGSKILITTRHTKVAETMGSVEQDIKVLDPLPNSDCWSILRQKAFKNKSFADKKMLETTGRLIADKCKGLPLAANVIGSHLRNANSLREWENVLNGEVWNMKEAKNELFPVLRFSYDKLDPVSKRCFSYCAMFPKDYKYDVELLKKLWMAQGFVPGRDASEIEIEAQKVFDNLAARSFFQDFVRKGISGCISEFKIHDIIHDFALSLIGQECFTINLDDDTPDETYSLQSARNVFISSSKSTPFSVNINGTNVHTFVFDGNGPLVINSFNVLKRARALVLHGHGSLSGILDEVENMIHLRLLELRYFDHELPETICNLFELQTLSIRCHTFCMIPQGIHRLQNLTHLHMDDDAVITRGLEKLTNLRTLVTFTVWGIHWLKFLKNLNQLNVLRILFRILTLHDASDVATARERAYLKDKTSLQYLHLRFCEVHDDTRNDLLEALQPHEKLAHLVLTEISRIPDWMDTLTNLRQLSLEDARITDWSCLGKLPALDNLTVSSWSGMSLDLLGMEVEPSSPLFPQLKELKFIDCEGWKEWIDINVEQLENDDISIFPCLQTLKIYSCTELKGLPHLLLRKATKLQLLRIENCEKIRSQYNQQDGEEREKISHISSIQFFK